MNWVRRYIPRIILADTVVYGIVIVILNCILSHFNLMFREWVYIVSAVLIGGGLIAGIIQLILKIKKTVVKVILICVFAALLVLASPMALIAVAFGYLPEYVVERDGAKYVAHVQGWTYTTVYYYDYKNFITVGNRKKIEEQYGKGGFDPIGNPYGYEYSVDKVIYYDDKGDIVRTEEMK